MRRVPAPSGKEPTVYVLDCDSPRHAWVLSSARGSKGKRTIHGHWDDWATAIKHSMDTARRCGHGSHLIIYPVPGRDKPCRTLKFPAHSTRR